MTGAALAFTAGVLLLQQQAALPPAPWLALLPVCIALAARAERVFELREGVLHQVR